MKKTLCNLMRNLYDFIKILALIMVSMALFGKENTLPAVSLAVALLMLPAMPLPVRGLPLALTMTGSFVLGAVAAQAGSLSPVLSAVVYFAVVMVLLVVNSQPFAWRPFMPYLLNFVFCHSQPVAGILLAKRLVLLVLGSLFVWGITQMQQGKFLEQAAPGFSLSGWLEDFKPSLPYAVKLATGLAVAMVIADVAGLAKPLWFSIVVMSLTELESRHMYVKIKDRLKGTVLGILGFVAFLAVVPSGYRGLGILALGYVSFFVKTYASKTVVNAISALNSSLLAFQPQVALVQRVGWLMAGVVLVLLVDLFYTLRHPGIPKASKSEQDPAKQLAAA